jgi:hypothetical protein
MKWGMGFPSCCQKWETGHCRGVSPHPNRRRDHQWFACWHCGNTGRFQTFSPCKQNERWHTDKLLGMSSLKAGVVWYICS